MKRAPAIVGDDKRYSRTGEVNTLQGGRRRPAQPERRVPLGLLVGGAIGVVAVAFVGWLALSRPAGGPAAPIPTAPPGSASPSPGQEVPTPVGGQGILIQDRCIRAETRSRTGPAILTGGGVEIVFEHTSPTEFSGLAARAANELCGPGVTRAVADRFVEAARATSGLTIVGYAWTGS